jgi:hypothetical protein
VKPKLWRSSPAWRNRCLHCRARGIKKS